MDLPLYEIVKKLVGPISPVGETNTDHERFKNLEAMANLIDSLLTDINKVALYNENRQEYSRQKAGKFASAFINSLEMND